MAHQGRAPYFRIPSNVIITGTLQVQRGISSPNFVDLSARGAVGDGVADDSDNIQQVINDVQAAGGGTVYCQAGTYKLVTGLTLPAGVSLLGAGKHAVIFQAGTVGMVMLTCSGENSVEGMYFKGLGTVGGGGERAIDTAAAWVNVRACRFSDVTSAIRYSGTSANDGLVTGCEFRNIVGQVGVSEGYGVHTSGSRTLVADNHFTTIQRHAVYMAATATDCTAIDNVINGCSHSALHVYATTAQAGCLRNRLIGNTLLACTGSAPINVSDNVQDTIIMGNIIDTQTGSAQPCIVVKNDAPADASIRCIRTSVIGNTIKNVIASSTGIEVFNTDDVLIEGNFVNGPGGGIGIYCYQSGGGTALTRRVRIFGNQVRNWSQGITLSGASVTEITLGGNSFNSNSTDIADTSGSLTPLKGGPVRIQGAAVSGASGDVTLGSSTGTTIGAAGGASALPATPLGYLIAYVGTTQVKIPYYNP